MRFAIGAAAILAAVSLGCDSDKMKDAAGHLENAAEEVGEAADGFGGAVEEGVENIEHEAQRLKQQLSDDAKDGKKRVRKAVDDATDDLDRAYRGLGDE